MAFQTNILRDGAWVTTTVDLNTVLKGSTVAATPAAPPLPTAPDCGILTRTVIESPIARWVLPALLRSAHHNDVAFVGDRYVSISELRKDGQLQEVLRKNDFGCRIRNACVIGNKYERFRATADDAGVEHIKSEDEDEDTQMADFTSATGPGGSHGVLPPHLLLLVLETGTFVFLFIRRDVHGRLQFVASPFHNPSKRMGHHLGFHVAVDPRSRYVAVADAQNKFAVYELESMEAMSSQYMRQNDISPVKTHHHRAVQGMILKMEFLYPRPEDQHHVILLIILAKGDKSKMVIYEWERGDNLGEVFAEEKRGYRIRPEHCMPLLVIPLTVRSSFLVVSENAFGICKDPLQGPIDIENHCPFDPKDHPTTRFHHGTGPPLWTAWDRPVRRRGYYDTNDHIYLAREDGVIVFFEFNSTDVLGVSMNVGDCDCNISSAFTTMYDAYSDFAIVAGDSGPGLVFQLKPRQSIVQLGPIPNWACAIDFTTTDPFSSWNPTSAHKSKPATSWKERTPDHLLSPHKIMCASGNDPQGSITELRYGLPANIISYFETHPTKRAWIFQAADTTWPYQMLLTSPGTSDILLVSADLSQAEMAEPTAVQLDTMSRTLAADQSRDGTITQVSERCITIASPNQSATSFAYAEFQGIDGVVEHAAVRGNCVCVSVFSESHFQIHTFRADNSDLALTDTYAVDGEVTCLSLCCIGGSECILAGLWRENSSYLAIYPADGLEKAPMLIGLDTDDEGLTAHQGDAMDITPTVELINSIVVVHETAQKTSVVLGTRSGHLITMQLNGAGPYDRIIRRERLGTVAAEVFPVDAPYLLGAVMACCNDALLLLRDFEAKRPGHFATKHRVWVTDLKDPATASVPVISATYIPIERSIANRMPLVLLSGEHISFTEIHLQEGSVPRRLPLHTGTPVKVLYSQTLQCLVVALQIGDQPNIMFMDHETGEDISHPIDRNTGNPTTFINGMGGHGDRILGVFEWLYTQASMTFHYLIITTRGGRLVLVSPTKDDYRDSEGKKRRRIRFVTRYKTKDTAPICSVVGDDQGLVYCAGKTLYWEVLDTAEKKLVRKKTYELNSPALSLRIVNGKVCALTLSDSLVIVDHKSDHKSDEMELIHMDETTRKSNHFFDVGDSADGSTAWPITLLCGMNRDFAAVWTPWQQRDRELELVAEGSLPASVRKLGRGHVRPEWVATEHVPRYGSIPSTLDGAEVVGMSLDGSVMHFSLLNMHAWRFLRFVQNLASRSQLLFPYSYEVSQLDDEDYDAEVKEMPKSMKHIDGDLLQRCADRLVLEKLISEDSDIDLLREYLDYLDDGVWTASFQDAAGVSKYFDLAYDVLDYYLTPVL
ncbi:thermotolerance protein [Colletotrichum karsti]|uniref:Thermotolerance protein n=1 Tax=Colletotrichum karsti TaxID=1095194 RepID=A0A9P6IDE6_9PEZI|nr:thermotolerance protein [Colletotrichum karsti]KAF9881367.1 thermotolerance protein [Colletotrichum karsti]